MGVLDATAGKASKLCTTHSHPLAQHPSQKLQEQRGPTSLANLPSLDVCCLHCPVSTRIVASKHLPYVTVQLYVHTVPTYCTNTQHCCQRQRFQLALYWSRAPLLASPLLPLLRAGAQQTHTQRDGRRYVCLLLFRWVFLSAFCFRFFFCVCAKSRSCVGGAFCRSTLENTHTHTPTEPGGTNPVVLQTEACVFTPTPLLRTTGTGQFLVW